MRYFKWKLELVSDILWVIVGELNKIFNSQDAIIPCEIFEQRSEYLQKLFKYNPRKCNSASSFSDCVHREKSKCLIALPTDAEHVKVFGKTLIGEFSCVSTRLTFGAQIFLNDSKNEKALFNLEINSEKQAKRISKKQLKMNENNQYGQAMTNHFYIVVVKNKKIPQICLNLIRY